MGPADPLSVLGAQVIYKSKIDNGPGNDVFSPAVVIRPEGVLAMLPDDMTVDLLVHGLGKDYREYAVANGDDLGEWCWP